DPWVTQSQSHLHGATIIRHRARLAWRAACHRRTMDRRQALLAGGVERSDKILVQQRVANSFKTQNATESRCAPVVTKYQILTTKYLPPDLNSVPHLSH